jgi:flagellar L-ring protein precursor FlgH
LVFSVFNFKFATPPALLAAMRLAAGLLLLAQPLAWAGPGSLWKDDSSRSMFADKRAHTVGDIITIVVQENNVATKENSTKTSKSTGVDASLNTVLFSPAASSFLTQKGQLPALKFSAKNDFDGGGKINNSERIAARIAVRVVDVLPNGNMIVEGRRDTSFSGEKQEAILRGLVRSEDVTANNTVFSYNVADASIQFRSKGTISDSQRKGWFTKLWDKLTPF